MIEIAKLSKEVMLYLPDGDILTDKTFNRQFLFYVVNNINPEFFQTAIIKSRLGASFEKRKTKFK